MLRSKFMAAAVSAALVLGGGLTLIATAAPAQAQSFEEQCDDSGVCLNLWNGGPYVQTYGGTTGNNNISIQWLPGRGAGYFQLVNNVEGYPNCLGDFNGEQGDARIGGFDTCNNPNTGYGGSWGTVFYMVRSNCPPGAGGLVPEMYMSAHWPGGAINHPGSGNNQPWYENSSPGDCLVQTS
jgi:hypothetical protein